MFSRAKKEAEQAARQAYLLEPLKDAIQKKYHGLLGPDMGRDALLEVVRRAKELLPDAKRLPFDPLVATPHGVSYLNKLIWLDQALRKQHWYQACTELEVVIELFHGTDRRVLYNLIKTLEDRL